MGISSPPFARIAIIGLGLIGGSLAFAVRRTWAAAVVIGVDCRDDAARAALECGAADVASTDIATVHDADLVVLAAPVGANLAGLSSVFLHAPPSAIVTDVGSTKRVMVSAARSLPHPQAFVGGHPLAGAASSGLSHARADLFSRRKWVFTPDDSTPSEALGRLCAFVAALGAEPCTMTPAEHDRVMASVSHLPQLASSALMHVVSDLAGEDGLAFGGAGLADTTRLAASPAGIWRDICSTNADNIRPALHRLIDELENLADRLAREDVLERLFRSARAGHDCLERHRGNV